MFEEARQALYVSLDLGGLNAMPYFEAAVQQLADFVDSDNVPNSGETMGSITVVYQIPGEIHDFGDRMSLTYGAWNSAMRNQAAIVTVHSELSDDDVTDYLTDTFMRAVEVARDRALNRKISKSYSFDAAVRVAERALTRLRSVSMDELMAEREKMRKEIVERARRMADELAQMKAIAGIE